MSTMDGGILCSPAPEPLAPPSRPWRRRLLLGGGLVAALLLGIELSNSLFGDHLHVVVPGQVYRSGQPTRRFVREVVGKYGIRTILNLRGTCEQADWYLVEARATAEFNLSQEDIAFSAGHLPPVNELRRLVEVLDRSAPPILIHCFRGVDRTGMASTVARLLKTDCTLDEATNELSLRYGHLPFGRTGHQEEFFQLYREWLQENQLRHAPNVFRDWVQNHYCPGACRAELQVEPPLQGPLQLDANQPTAVRVRCKNTSIRGWRFTPDPNAGIHLTWALTQLDRTAVAMGRVGLFPASVAPGEEIALTMVIPPLRAPGDYLLQIDLVEAEHCLFRECGSQLLELEVQCR